MYMLDKWKKKPFLCTHVFLFLHSSVNHKRSSANIWQTFVFTQSNFSFVIIFRIVRYGSVSVKFGLEFWDFDWCCGLFMQIDTHSRSTWIHNFNNYIDWHFFGIIKFNKENWCHSIEFHFDSVYEYISGEMVCDAWFSCQNFMTIFFDFRLTTKLLSINPLRC